MYLMCVWRFGNDWVYKIFHILHLPKVALLTNSSVSQILKAETWNTCMENTNLCNKRFILLAKIICDKVQSYIFECLIPMLETCFELTNLVTFGPNRNISF